MLISVAENETELACSKRFYPVAYYRIPQNKDRILIDCPQFVIQTDYYVIAAMRVYLLVILLWAMLWPAGQAQEFKVTYTHIGVEEGLAGSGVYCAFQDSDGYIWFGTETGVSRYNGKRFENFSTSDGLADNEVFKIIQDKGGRIWFSAFNGQLSYFLEGKFYNATNDPFLSKLKVNSHFVDLLTDDTGTLWISTIQDGIITIEPSGEPFYYSEILSKRGMAFMLRTDGASVSAFHSIFGELHLSQDMSVPEALPKTKETDQLLFGLTDKYLHQRKSQLIKDSGLFRRYSQTLLKRIQSWTSDITKVHNYGGETWYCTYSGAYMIKEGSEATPFSLFNDFMVTHVLKDREGNYWFTTLGNGVFYVSSLESQSVRNEQSGVLEGVSALMKGSKGKVFFAGNGGIHGTMSHGKIDVSQMTTPINRSMVKNIETGYKENQFLLSSDNALIEVVDGRVTRSTALLAKSIRKWTEELYAIGTNQRLLLLDKNQLDRLLDLSQEEFDDSDLEKLPSSFTHYLSPLNHWIIDIEPFGEGLLLGTLGGVFYFSPDYEIQPVEGPAMLQKRINDIAILDEKGSFAVATHGYGIIIKTDSGWTSVTEKEGLRSAIVRKIWYNHPDTLWVATHMGVDRIIRGTELQIKSMTQSDGLLSEDVYDVLVSEDQLVAATDAGLSLVDLMEWEQPGTAPLIHLKQLSVDGLERSEDTLRIAFNNREIRIDYDGIHFASKDRLSYQYRMLGLDNTWQTTNNDEITFGRLLPGAYTFEVQAINSNGVLSNEVARQTLIVERPFWWQLWFLVLAPLSLLITIIWITIYLVRRSKMKTQRALETRLHISETERRLLKAQVKPHFTYNILNSIQNMILKEETEKAYEFMGEFAALMRRDLDAYDQNSISLEEELELLESYLKLEKLRFLENEWEYEIVLDEGLSSDQIQVPPMFLQPFVENTIKHGFSQVDYPGKILIRGFRDEKHLNFEVVDNGIGLGVNSKATYASKGIAIVRKRLQLVNRLNQVSINDREDGQGVRVSIQMALST